MTHRNFPPNQQWPAFSIVGARMRDMQYAAILDAGSAPYPYAVHVTPNHCLWPYRDIVTQNHVAQNNSTGVDVNSLTELRMLTFEHT